MTFTNKLVSSNSFKSELGEQKHTVYYIIRVSNVFFFNIQVKTLLKNKAMTYIRRIIIINTGNLK